MVLSGELFYFSIFIVFILGVLVFDLLVVGRKSHVVSFKEASFWSVVWISSALGFYLVLLFFGEKIHGIEDIEKLKEVAQVYAPHLHFESLNFEEALSIYRKNMSIEYLTGYIIEYSLSIDNIFVIIMILSAFSVREKHYKPVLFWGILGAIVLRCIFIFAGAALIRKFDWILLIFGAFLIYSGIKMYLSRNKEEKIEPQKHKLVIFLSKHISVFPRYVGGRFFIKKDGDLYITPLFIVLILIEFTDLIFALDSIPAIFAVTRDPYIVFFSNIFAIIGLRSLFFMLMKIIHIFHYLKVGVAFLLAFVGFKLLAHHWLEEIGFESAYSLYIILFILSASIIASLLFPKPKPKRNPLPEKNSEEFEMNK